MSPPLPLATENELEIETFIDYKKAKIENER
jgi:hypothetical protein